jgi:hypothetical protein
MIKAVRLFIIIAILLVTLSGSAQKIGVGASAIYNFQTESLGAGVRVNIFPNNKLSFVPQASYFFSGPVNEYTVGLALEYKVIQREKFNIYALAHGGYNSWLTYANSGKEGAKPSNWNGEIGAGITTNHCLRPFLEYRYNFKFLETHLDFGFLYIFGCRGGRNVHRCAAY